MEKTPYYNKQMTCIHCKKEFATTKVRQSFVKLESTESDFKPVYESINPIYYNVFVCEHCGLAFTEDFSPYFAPGSAEMLEERICNHWQPHSFSGERTLDQAIQAYQLSIICGEIKKEKHVVLAGLALRTAWLYRDNKKTEWELRFIESARDEYIECYLQGDYQGTPMTEIKVLFIIGELSRRLDDLETATKYFSKVLEKQSTTTETGIIQKTKEVWQDIRNQKDKLPSA